MAISVHCRANAEPCEGHSSTAISCGGSNEPLGAPALPAAGQPLQTPDPPKLSCSRAAQAYQYESQTAALPKLSA